MLSLILILSFYIFYFNQTLKIKNLTYFNVSKKLNFPDFFSYYNPSGFVHNNKLYTVHRIHFCSNFFYGSNYRNKSFIAISREDNDKVIYVNVPEISQLNKFNNLSKDKIYRVNGYEDPRAFIFRGMLCLLVNTCALNEKYTQMCLIKFKLNEINLEEDDIINSSDVILLQPSFNDDRSQKNWMPLVKDNRLFLIFCLNPLKVFECDVETGLLRLLYEGNLIKSIPSPLRGSSNIIEYYSKFLNKKVFLGICHIRRHYFYTHLFILFDFDYPFKILGVSDEFIICDDKIKFSNYFYINSMFRIQFVSSILKINNNLLVFYGEKDKVSKKFEISLENVEKTIKLV